MYMFSIRYMQMRALLVILEKPSFLTWKQFNKNKPSFVLFFFWWLASSSTCAECISDYKVSAGKRQFVTRRRQDVRSSEEPTFTGSSLASVGHSHCTSSTEVKWRWMRGVSMVSAEFHISGAVQCLYTEDIQNRRQSAAVWLEAGTTCLPSFSPAGSVLSFPCSVLTRGDVTWIVRVRTDMVLVTAMAASPGHWLTVYVPAELSCLKRQRETLSSGTKQVEADERRQRVLCSTSNCADNFSATCWSRVTVGLLEHSSTNSSSWSPFSRRPLATSPTLITPRKMWSWGLPLALWRRKLKKQWC